MFVSIQGTIPQNGTREFKDTLYCYLQTFFCTAVYGQRHLSSLVFECSQICHSKILAISVESPLPEHHELTVHLRTEVVLTNLSGAVETNDESNSFVNVQM